MKNVYVFDVDGTLSPARQTADPEFARYFLGFAQRNAVFLISGSDHGKIEEQIGSEILSYCNGVFSCSGAEYREMGNIVYQKNHVFDPKIVEASGAFVENSLYKEKSGNHLEFRVGMLNVSSVGRNASLLQRRAYHVWDGQRREREEFIDLINSLGLPYEASAGGEISVDIVPKGWNKSVAKDEILKRHPDARIHFFGDRMERDGNDFPLAAALNTPHGIHAAIPVEGYNETWFHLQHFEAVEPLAA